MRLKFWAPVSIIIAVLTLTSDALAVVTAEARINGGVNLPPIVLSSVAAVPYSVSFTPYCLSSACAGNNAGALITITDTNTNAVVGRASHETSDGPGTLSATLLATNNFSIYIDRYSNPSGPRTGLTVDLFFQLPDGSPCPVLDTSPPSPSAPINLLTGTYSYACTNVGVTMQTTKLQDAVIASDGSSQQQTIVAGGGTLPYQWSLSGDPTTRPAGLYLDPGTGVLQVRADIAAQQGRTITPGTFPVTIAVQDNSSPVQQATKTFSLNIVCGPGGCGMSVSGKNQGAPDGQCGRCSRTDPIDIGSGNMFEQVTDYQTAGPNVLSFTRSYNSMATAQSLATRLGRNWRSNFDRYLRLTSASMLTVERPDGQELNFTSTDGAWTSDSDVDLRLGQTGSGIGSNWYLVDRNDTLEIYKTISATEAILTGLLFRNGYQQSLQYDGDNNLLFVTDSYGRTLQFSYQNGLLRSLSTPDGLTLTYGYDSSGAIAGVDDRLISVAYSTNPQTSQSYRYEDANFPFALTGLVDENGNRFTTWGYDALGRAIYNYHGSGLDCTSVTYHDDDSRVVVNALGQQDVYSFAVMQGVPKVTEIDRLATDTSAAATRLFTYDVAGYKASETDWNGNLTTYFNDERGLPTIITNAPGTPQERTTAITYESTFHLPAQIVEPGLTTDFTYDDSGNLLTKTLTDTTTTTIPYLTKGTKRTWTYTWANSLLASVKGPRTDVSELTSYSYDASGTLVKTTNALGQNIQVTQHTGGGLPLTIVDANGVTTKLTYDERLRLKTSTLNTGAGNLTTTYTYDAVGNVLGITLPDGSKLAKGYDAAYRLTSVTNLFNETIDYTLDTLGDRLKTEFKTTANVVKGMQSGTFDALGQVLQNTGGAGQVTTYTYDGNGHAVTITDPLNRVTHQHFDPLNRLDKVTDAANGVITTAFDAHDRPLSATAPNGAVTSYVYDGFGDLIQTISPDTGKTIYRYDLGGNLTQKVDAAGAITNNTYDALDRVRTTTYPADAAENVTYSYDQSGHGLGIGRLTSLTDAIGTLNRSYDERGNILSEKRVHGSITLSTAYTYDAVSRVSSITYPSGAAVGYSRDGMGRVSGITVKPKNATALTVASGIGYQPFGPVNSLKFGNNITESRSYDADYRLTNLIAGAAEHLTYNYDAADDVRSIIDGITPANNQSFGYDSLDRLTSATGGYGSLAYSYDSVGNRLTQQAGSTLTNYTYTPKSNRLTQIKSGTALQVFAYTPTGNITSMANVPSTRPAMGIAYNQTGRLATVLSGGQQTMRYIYDAFGQRLIKIGTLTATTLFQYDQKGHLLETTDDHGNPQVDYIYLDDQPIATWQASANKLYFLHDDRLGTPQRATDGRQLIVWAANYEPFGYTATGAAPIVQNLRLPGQEFEAETGWNHNGFRDYTPVSGRFLQSDPIGLIGGINSYVLVANNPLKYIDFLGLDGTPRLPGPPADTQQAFEGTIEAGPAENNITAYRYFGGQASMEGSFLSPTLYNSPEAARSALSLPPGNSAEYVCKVEIPIGTQMQIGQAAPAFRQPGGGKQIQLLERLPSSAFKVISKTTPIASELLSGALLFLDVFLHSSPAY